MRALRGANVSRANGPSECAERILESVHAAEAEAQKQFLVGVEAESVRLVAALPRDSDELADAFGLPEGSKLLQNLCKLGVEVRCHTTRLRTTREELTARLAEAIEISQKPEESGLGARVMLMPYDLRSSGLSARVMQDNLRSPRLSARVMLSARAV